MKRIDRFLQRWRIRQAARWIPNNSRLIDIGAYHGETFTALGYRLSEGFGIEPLLDSRIETPSFVIEPGYFPAVRPAQGDWDAITMLAVFEHIPDVEQKKIVDACYDLLRPEGRVIITVPAHAVDRILSVLKFLHLIDGMSLEEHHGFIPTDTPRIFASPRFRLVQHSRFQLGLNHLFVFEKTNHAL
jgi:SAM-dependent methyltransferase